CRPARNGGLTDQRNHRTRALRDHPALRKRGPLPCELILRAPSPTLFPYTTLFRSRPGRDEHQRVVRPLLPGATPAVELYTRDPRSDDHTAAIECYSVRGCR